VSVNTTVTVSLWVPWGEPAGDMISPDHGEAYALIFNWFLYFLN